MDQTENIIEVETKTEKRKLTKEERYEIGKRNLIPLKPYAEQTEEERKRHHEIAVKGGKARAQQMINNVTWKEQALKLLATKVSKEQAIAMIGEDANLLPTDADLTVQGVLTVKVMQEFIANGNVKALEFLRDTSGQKPTNEIEITADIMTDDDRDLLKSVSSRLGVG